MPKDFYAALCLVLVFEGLMLFAAPAAWQRMARQAAEMEPKTLRLVGAAALAIGVIALRFVF
ncbi:DUF2065 domain-containing protein [Oleiagrimonas soli]|uniref:DUF2065 domain-containing protein n=1 Tax=Oleiagrimonas soli TaxID=1543381 RepID=A0A099CUI2_9GAMM|nr:DUF2065 domain-containing protein [Oleiagrimonas soli]KGI77351.1 hypothetical protein LF63_0110755 [Oleiagrimonas soli]MBB6182732.1 hypothetical protein [Oleiagrimonas soli]